MKFSIITAVKNNKEGLIRAIECVRNQTYKNIEHIIVDGGSTDGTQEILRGVYPGMNQWTQNGKKSTVILNDLPAGKAGMKDLHSGRVSSLAAQNDSQLSTNYQLLTISEPDSGIYDAINKGIKLATGDVIGLLHSDDLYADEKVIERYAETFKIDSGSESGMTKQIDAVYSDLVYVSKVSGEKSRKSNIDNQPNTNYLPPATGYSIVRYWKAQKSDFTAESQKNRAIKHGWMPPHPTLFIRKKIFDKYGLYRTDMKIAADYEMILRLFYKHKISAHCLPLTTYMMTIGGTSNKSIANIIQKSKEDLRAMKLNGISFPAFTIFCKNIIKVPQFLVRSL